MNSRAAIMAFSQSEKIKAGLIWAEQSLEVVAGVAEARRGGAVETVRVLVGSIGNEALLARRLCGDDAWLDVERHIDMALVMIRSGVPAEAGFHLSRALSRVTDLGQRAMTWLGDNRLL